MNWRTSPTTIQLRNLGRKLGINRVLGGFMARKGYEAQYDRALANRIGGGHVVWDIGANVGLYTKQFAKLVGNEGQVFAFEPSPVNFRSLFDECNELNNVTLISIGLGRENCFARFEQGNDELGATSRVVEGDADGDGVTIKTGDTIIGEEIACQPNVIKIDVEGLELDVLVGLEHVIQNSSLHTLGIEIHFRILSEAGRADAPQEIVQRLSAAGFQISWPDPSHLLAIR